MQKMFLHLQKVLDEFPDSYVVIGGLAATLLGAPRTTVDVDVVMLLSPQEVERTVRICEQQGLHPRADAVVRLKEGRPVKFAFSRRFSVDLRLASFSLDRMAIRRAQVVFLFGYPLRIATPEDLIVYKLARWSAIDQEDVKHIILHFGDSLDISYLEEQVCLLREEAGLPSMMERWHSIHSRLIAPDVSPEDDPEELSDGWLGKAGV